ncbi:MAG: GNAT family N-acetyltransferase [Clostridia bacterium]|nr:GNAT family N-acetyltransferase [Clostridia bacterium]
MFNLENIKFRKATIADCPKLSYLKKEIYENTFRGIYPDKFIDNYDYDANVKKFESFVLSTEINLYVVTDSNEIIGYFEYGKPYRPFGDYTQEIGLFYLKKEYRKLGIGRQMFNLAYEEIKNTGVDKFFISCNKFNTNAQKFYEKMGGKIVHIDEDDANDGVPQIKFEYLI